MSSPDMRAEQIFAAALEIEHPARRYAFIEAACGGEEKLRREVDHRNLHFADPFRPAISHA